MKVLFINHVTEMHGSSISMFTLIKGLKERGVDVAIIVPKNWNKDDTFISTANKLNVHLFFVHLVHSRDCTGWSRKPWRIRIFYQELKDLIHQRKVSYKQISKVVEEVRPDIIHTNVGIIHDGFWVAKKYGIPHVFHIREYQDRDFGWKILPTKWLFELMLKQSEAVFTITDSIRDYFHLSKSTNSITLYNGIYTKDYTVKTSKKDNTFLFVSRISPEKGIEDIIISFAEFNKTIPGWKLQLAGSYDDNYKKHLLTISAKLGCIDSVNFVGFVKM